MALAGVGSTSAAINGMMTAAPMSAVCAMIDSGTVYQALLPTLIDGSTTSPNMSRGTGYSPQLVGKTGPLELKKLSAKGGEYSQMKNRESTYCLSHLDTGSGKTGTGFRHPTSLPDLGL
ncbi:MAG: hypothetical protein AB7I04_25600, partial [Pseudomonadales bacterium]